MEKKNSKGGGFYRNRYVANAIAVIGLMAGWFGWRPKQSDWQAESTIGGWMGGNSSRMSKIRKRHRSMRHRVGYGVGHRRRYMRSGPIPKPAIHYKDGKLVQAYELVSGGRGTEWIKENRRRRAYGLPQLRAENV